MERTWSQTQKPLSNLLMKREVH